jgi:hypothetical protein
MSAISRVLRATNWKYAIGEMALIFVGITLALIANSWYESLKSREEEREILEQLAISLETDVQALRATRDTIDQKVRLMTRLEKHIQEGLPYTADLDASFKTILGGSSVQMSTAAFDTLKYRGIDLISDSAIRRQLVGYYDTEQARLERRNSYDRGDQSLAEPYFKKNFRWESGELLMAPVDYDSLVVDQEFLNILAVRIWALRNLASPTYDEIANEAAQLANAIQEHKSSLP